VAGFEAPIDSPVPEIRNEESEVEEIPELFVVDTVARRHVDKRKPPKEPVARPAHEIAQQKAVVSEVLESLHHRLREERPDYLPYLECLLGKRKVEEVAKCQGVARSTGYKKLRNLKGWCEGQPEALIASKIRAN
jgi:hypothetical protein